MQITLATSPAGLSLRLDGQPQTTPLTFTGVVGIQRTLEAPSPQTVGGRTYEFDRWSDGGARVHTVSTPSANTTYTAFFREVPTGSGGLTGTYFDNIDFTGASVTRVDGTVDFDWASGPPAAGIAADTFSVRWVGSVQVPTTGTYTFFTQSDDGVRLWVNGQQVVNNWTDHAFTENSGTIALVAGVRYELRMEFYENGGAAVAKLLWSGPTTPKAVVPSSALGTRLDRADQLPACRRPRSRPVTSLTPGRCTGCRQTASATAGTPTTRPRRATATRRAPPTSATTR